MSGSVCSMRATSSRFCRPRMVLLKMKLTKGTFGMPPRQHTSRYLSVNPSHGAMALRDGGFWTAVVHWVVASQELPCMPIEPLHQSWAAMNSQMS